MTKALSRSQLPKETLSADKKACRRFGPCGVGERALYLNSFWFERFYYVPIAAVRRVFKRVAMSQGGFTGKGAFGTIPYLVVEYDDGQQKQCTFKREEDVDLLLAHLAAVHPEIPGMSRDGERRLAEKAEKEAKRYLKELSPQAEKARQELEQAKATLQKKPELCARLSAAAKAKRIDDRSNHAYRWVALAIMLAGFIALVYGIRSLARKDTSGLYFLLLGLAAIFLFSGLHVFPTAKNNRKAIAKEWQDSIAAMEKALPIGFPVPARYAHPIVLERMIRVIREGRAQTAAEALAQVKEDLKALTADVQVEQEEHDEVVAITPMFLLQDYQYKERQGSPGGRPFSFRRLALRRGASCARMGETKGGIPNAEGKTVPLGTGHRRGTVCCHGGGLRRGDDQLV